MKTSAIKKADGKIWMVHGDASRAMEPGDQLIELPDEWEQPSPKYRDCWAEKDGEIVVDLTKAKAQRLSELRAEREAKRAESYKEFMIAMSKGESTEAIMAKKQALRDLPEAIESALSAKKKLDTVDAYEPEWP